MAKIKMFSEVSQTLTSCIMAKYLYKLKSLRHKPQEACDTFIREDSQKSCLNKPLQYDTEKVVIWTEYVTMDSLYQ